MDRCDVLVIGGGPAGLRTAEICSAAGRQVILADRMPSVGRKLLVAGRGGLNLTHAEPLETFVTRYGDEHRWRALLEEFSPNDLRAWAGGLGIETFVGTSRRVFPTSKQAAPLLRRWVARLKAQGVQFRLRHDLRRLKIESSPLAFFQTPKSETTLQARAVVLALGGGSWPQTGSNAAWIPLLQAMGVGIVPFAPANCGYEVDWPKSFLAEAEGRPLKNIRVRAGEAETAGELLVTRHGLEGGALYQLGPVLRGMPKPSLVIDLKPTFTAQQLAGKLDPSAANLLEQAIQRWKLGTVAAALLRLVPVPSANALAALAKSFPLTLTGPRPLEEAISSAGGIAWRELDDHLMLRRLPGLFCAGEMIDWEAPTGGYLLQGCFATAMRAARGVIAYSSGDDGRRKND